jgi:hypothetical protein
MFVKALKLVCDLVLVHADEVELVLSSLGEPLPNLLNFGLNPDGQVLLARGLLSHTG